MFYVHVNQHKIRSNIKNEDKQPPIAVRRGKSGEVRYGNDVVIPGPSRLVYSPDAPVLSCGARLVLMSEGEPEIVS